MSTHFPLHHRAICFLPLSGKGTQAAAEVTVESGKGMQVLHLVPLNKVAELFRHQQPEQPGVNEAEIKPLKPELTDRAKTNEGGDDGEPFGCAGDGDRLQLRGREVQRLEGCG